ncbi:MAG: 6-carboxytetrahydropterin synthase QueD [Candidatus Bathyarchaeota archaeon]|nr:6-carboxytetrahydropterin synthase QueD [Candidatus Bathyarchaeota archaeon]
MYRLRVEVEFDAAHKLIGYNGKCANLHGHTWRVEVFVRGDQLDDIGIVIDYNVLKQKLEDITEKLDHSCLNDNSEIGNPSSENLAKYIFKKMKLPDNVQLEAVRVWENPRSWCEYYE